MFGAEVFASKRTSDLLLRIKKTFQVTQPFAQRLVVNCLQTSVRMLTAYINLLKVDTHKKKKRQGFANFFFACQN